MKAAEPVPRTQPYSNPRRPLPGGGTAALSAKASARMVTGQRRGMPQAQRQKRPEALRREIAQGHHGGQPEADHQHDTKPVDRVAEAPGEGCCEQADAVRRSARAPAVRLAPHAR